MIDGLTEEAQARHSADLYKTGQVFTKLKGHSE